MPNIMFKVGATDYSANVIDNSNGYKVQSERTDPQKRVPDADSGHVYDVF